jgi:hypothetical protein
MLFMRGSEKDVLLCAHNLSAEVLSLKLDLPEFENRKLTDLLTKREFQFNGQTLELAAYESLLLKAG